MRLLSIMLISLFLFACAFSEIGAMTMRAEAYPQIGPGTVEIGVPFSVDLYMNNNDYYRLGHSMSFVFYSPDASIYEITHDTVELKNGFEPGDSGFFDGLNLISYFSWDGILPDTVNLAAMSIGLCYDAWPDDLGERNYIRFYFVIDEEGIFCIDSVDHPDHRFDWLFEDPSPSFGGPYCWAIQDEPPQPGRCCYGDPSSPSCDDLFWAECTALADMLSWDENLSCTANPCEPYPDGRCCYGNELSPDCDDITEPECSALIDMLSWDENLSCTANPCEPYPIGRCCYGNHSTPGCDDLTESECLAVGSMISWNEGLNCAVNPCDTLHDLVGYWSFDEGAGDTAYDGSGQGNNGILQNGPSWTAGVYGTALEFDGIDDYVEIFDSPSLDIDGPEITFMAWIYSPGFQDFGWIIGKKMVWWLLPKSDGAIRYGISSGGTTHEQWDIPVGLATNVWQHVAVTYDASYMRFFLNGLAVDSFPKTGNMGVSDASVLIGLDGLRPFYHYFGKIDEVKLLSKALTSEEIIYEMTRPIRGYWNFDEGTGDSVFDLSGNENNGVLIDNPVWTDGIYGTALDFDGIDDFVEIPHKPSLNIPGPFTVIAWIYPRTLPTGVVSFVNKYSNYLLQTGFHIPGELRLAFRNQNSSWRSLESNEETLILDTWQHVAGVWTGDSIVLYKDGQVVASAYIGANTPLVSTNPLNFAAENSSWQHFHGKIDEVKLLSIALTQPEIFSEYVQGRCGDANGDYTTNILDITYLISFLYKGGPAPELPEAADVNDDGAVNILDITYLIAFLYKNGPDPVCPR